jgi:AcrR family transcriptional regulator
LLVSCQPVEVIVARRSAAESERTRDTILVAARQRFTLQGYNETRVVEIAGDASVTDGAIFHHFRSKKGLFRAVFERLEAELDAASRAASREGPPAKRFVEGCRAYLNFVAREDYARIAMRDAPAILGRGDWHDIDAGLGLKTVMRGVENLMKHGVIEPQPVKPLAVLLFGALNESGFLLARREPDVNVDGLVAVLERLLPRL